MIDELIWILIIVAITAWAIKGVNDFNRMVDIGVAKLAEKGKEEDRWTPASELLSEMDEKEQKLREENKVEPDDEGDDDAILMGL